MRARSLMAVAVTLFVAVLAACGTDQDPAIDVPVASTATTTAVTDTSTASTQGAAGAFAGSTTPVSVAGSGPKSYLVAVRAAKQDGYERVVFEFREPVPGYKVEYGKRPITEDGSGDEVQVEGGAVLVVRMEPASGFDTDAGDGGKPTYAGPRRVDPATTAVTELVRTGDFEAVLTWAVGVDRQRPFRVTTSSSPKPVLIIDISTA